MGYNHLSLAPRLSCLIPPPPAPHWNHKVGQVAKLADLHGTENGEVNVAAANHSKGFVTAKEGGAFDCRHSLLALSTQRIRDEPGRRRGLAE